MYRLIFLLVILFILTIAMVIVIRYRYTKIPKIIWTYWNDGIDRAPPLIKTCVATWKRHNKDYEIRILTQDNYRQYLPDIDVFQLKHADSQARISDFIRLHVLARYGGVWCDASIAMTKSLSWIDRDAEFVGYYLNGFTTKPEYPVIESWFLACPPKATFITLWRDEFMRLNEFEQVADYVKDIEKDTIIDNIQFREYLAIHLAAQKVMQHRLSAKDMSKIMFYEAERGPLSYLANADWDSEKALRHLCEHGVSEEPLLKFRSTERYVLENDDELNDCLKRKFDFQA